MSDIERIEFYRVGIVGAGVHIQAYGLAY